MRARTRIRLIAAIAAPLAAAPAVAQLPTPTHAAVPYGDGHVRQILDIYMPPGPSTPRPAVFWLHGGGWRSGSRAGGAERAPLLLERGIALVAIEYRYSSDALFPAQVHDCKAAIRWLRAHADEYNIDPARIGVWGASSGGHLAALVGTSAGDPACEGTVGGNTDQPSNVLAVADYYGHTDFFSIDPANAACGTSESELLGACLIDIQQNVDNPAWAELVARARLASPLTHVSPDDPPFLILHGGADTVVLPLQSHLLHDALTEAGVASDLRIVPGAPHNVGLGFDQFTADFFALHLADPGCLADWNNDGEVNSGDVSTFLAHWLRCVVVGSLGADVNDSGAVNSADIAAYLTMWITSIGPCGG